MEIGKPTCNTESDWDSDPDIDAKLDKLYDDIDEMMWKQQLDKLNRLMAEVDILASNPHILLGWLTATLPVRDKLTARRDFYEAVESELYRREIMEPGLLDGLK